MSGVRKKDQSPHRFTTLDLILKMYDHTTAVIANEKIFDPKYRKLIDDIDDNARQIYHLCRVANEELDNRVKEEAKHRIVQEGKLTKHDVDVHFKAWKASVRYGNSHNLIYRLNRWYESLWNSEVKYD